MKTKTFFQQLLLWTLIIVIAWFVFSGGIGKVWTSYNYREQLSDNKEVFYNEDDLIDLQVSCEFFKGALISERTYVDFTTTQNCKTFCSIENKDLVNYQCIEGEMYCICD